MIELKNLTKAYGSQTIFKNISFTFPDTGLVCILGASGCGKSTLINMLAGFDSDYRGSISVCGTELNSLTDKQLCDYRRDNIGFVFQNYNLLSGYTISENILLSCKPNSENQLKATELMIRFDIIQKADAKIENLSGGQKQRTAIIRALMGNPQVILADEPTGALDRKNSNDIMELLRELSKEKLVLVITHDKKICEFADEVITIEIGQLVGNSADISEKQQQLKVTDSAMLSPFKFAIKNFKVHIRRFTAVALAISIGVLAFMLSLSSGNIIDKSISDFKEKNTAFNNGYVKADKEIDEILKILQKDTRLENVYKQYVIHDVSLTIADQTETTAEKYPMPKATQNMSYGIMPKKGENQIAFSPSLAKKFENSIEKLIGKELKLNFGGNEYTLKVSGIFNGEYDDFFVSSDIEQKFYSDSADNSLYSVSYDAKSFDDIVPVTEMLTQKNIKSNTAAKEVGALQNTFQNLSRLFLIVSVLILLIGLFLSTVLLFKLQNSRYREIGLLSALGFYKKQIRAMVLYEALFLSFLSAMLNMVFMGLACFVSAIAGLNLIVTAPHMILSVLSTGVIIMLISLLASHKFIHTEPAIALRK